MKAYKIKASLSEYEAKYYYVMLFPGGSSEKNERGKPWIHSRVLGVEHRCSNDIEMQIVTTLLLASATRTNRNLTIDDVLVLIVTAGGSIVQAKDSEVLDCVDSSLLKYLDNPTPLLGRKTAKYPRNLAYSRARAIADVLETLQISIKDAKTYAKQAVMDNI